jgi:DNA repair photolyase
MSNIPPNAEDDNQVKPYKALSDDPVIKKILARVSDVEARQASIELRQADLEQANRWAHNLMERMHERQEHLLAQTDFIVEWIKARGDTGALDL